MFDCAIVYTNDLELYNDKNVDSYIIFNSEHMNKKIIKKSKSKSKTKTKTKK